MMFAKKINTKINRFKPFVHRQGGGGGEFGDGYVDNIL
jgi:hypothetical protein